MIGPYLVNSITHKQDKGRDKWGTPNARDSITRKARIDYKNRSVVNMEGETVVSSAKVFIRPLTIIRSGFSARVPGTIAYEDLINFDSTDHKIITIGKIQDFSVKFLEVWVV